MYEEWGGAPSAGCVTGVGAVSGRTCVVVANDATVKAGAWFPITCKKILRAQEIALENRLPLVYLVDSSGVFLPLQDEIFPDKEHFGRVFYNNARLSAAGIYQIAAIMGPCVAGGAYLPIMSDEALIVEGTGSIFLAGPHLVKAAIGEQIEAEALGGAEVQSDISMVVDDRFPDDADLPGRGARPRRAARRAAPRPVRPHRAGRTRGGPGRDRGRDAGRPDAAVRDVRAAGAPARRLGVRGVQGDLGPLAGVRHGPHRRLGGGVVANQRAVVARRRGLGPHDKEMQIGGVIYADGADKGARFVELCNQKGIPLLFLQDVTGFMVGSRAEREGIIKDGAKMVNVVANSTVPKVTIVVGNSYGAGNYAMAGKAYGPRFIFAWPSASIAVMGGEQAAQTLLSIQLKNRGNDVSEERSGRGSRRRGRATRPGRPALRRGPALGGRYPRPGPHPRDGRRLHRRVRPPGRDPRARWGVLQT